MPPLCVMVKPVSGLCNMRCRYCFYSDLLKNRSVPGRVMMNTATLAQTVSKALSAAQDTCNFVFQGGEPTMAGLDFYKSLLKLQADNNPRGIRILNSIQTNGTLIDEKWAEFFAKNGFLVGLSLDGLPATHDANRVNASGVGSFDTVMAAAELLKAKKVDFNILTVVTAQVALSVEPIYKLYRDKGFDYQQYIPCLDGLGEKRGGRGWSLTPALYGDFLCRLFDLWHADVKAGREVHVRYFEQLVGLQAGVAAADCGICGVCPAQYVVEADGSVYPCDFYVLPQNRVGSVLTDDFVQIEKKRLESEFFKASKKLHPACTQCRYYYYCHGGCRRDRDYFDGRNDRVNYFCDSYRKFFEYAMPRIRELAK